MKKRLITMFLVGAAVLGTLSACGNTPQEGAETTSPSAEIAEKDDNQEETDRAAEEEEADEAKQEEADTAKQEEANAAYEAGYNCFYGENGKEIDLEEAYTNFNHALELGVTEANFYLGLLCDWYNIPQRDYEKAKAYYEAAGDNSSAQVALGFLYYYGQGVEQDVEKAQELFDAAIEQGDKGGYLGNAAISYDKGDYTAALDNYNKVLEGSERIFLAEAMREIGDLYGYGQGVEQDYSQAFEWQQKAADVGSVSAMTTIGNMYFNGVCVEQDYTQAMEWYRKAADLGNTSAMIYIGNLYANGQGVESDYDQAIEWYKKAADLGSVNAMYYIGWIYDMGMKDYPQALEWYEKAADLESVDAMLNIGYLYENGFGVEQDYAQALEWYEKAAELGNAIAMQQVGRFYENGMSVEQDMEKAQEWYTAAEAAQ